MIPYGEKIFAVELVNHNNFENRFSVINRPTSTTPTM